MSRPDEVTFELACGARCTVRVEVDVTTCRDGDGRCPSAADVAAMIWMSMQDEGEQARTPDDYDSDGG